MTDLAKLIVPSKESWFDFDKEEFPGLKFKLAYLSKDELTKMRRKCITTRFDRKTRQQVEDLDTDLLQDLYLKAVLKDWKGLTYEYLEKLIPLDTSTIKDKKEELAYSEQNALILVKNSNDVDAFITESIEDLSNFLPKA